MINRKSTLRKTDTNTDEDRAPALPLSVWEKKGFNAADIQANTPMRDQMDRPVLGRCYRVRINTVARTRGQGLDDELTIIPPDSRRIRQALAASEAGPNESELFGREEGPEVTEGSGNEDSR